MTRSRFFRFAHRSLLAASFTLVAGSSSLTAMPKDQVPPKPYPDSQIPAFDPGTTVPVLLPDLTLMIKKVTCFNGHVAVKVRLQDQQSGNIGITAPFVTEVKVGSHTAIIASNASPQNPWYNGQEKGANLFPGTGTFQVSAVVDSTNLVVEADEGDNLAPSAANSFDPNPTPLTVTCDAPSAQNEEADAEAPASLEKRDDAPKRERLMKRRSTPRLGKLRR